MSYFVEHRSDRQLHAFCSLRESVNNNFPNSKEAKVMFPMIDCLVKFLEKCIIGIPFENLESLSENLLMWKEFVLSQGLEPHPDWDRVEITRENFLACVSQSRYEFTIARIKEK